MGRTQKVVTTVLWGVLVLTMVAVVGAGLFARRQAGAKRDAVASGDDSDTSTPAIVVEVPADDREPLAPRFRVPTFELTNQEGRTVRDTDLRGSTWVAAFIFTSCGADCPMMSR